MVEAQTPPPPPSLLPLLPLLPLLRYQNVFTKLTSILYTFSIQKYTPNETLKHLFIIFKICQKKNKKTAQEYKDVNKLRMWQRWRTLHPMTDIWKCVIIVQLWCIQWHTYPHIRSTSIFPLHYI